MNGWIHQGIIAIHIVGGPGALACGTAAVAARKGGARAVLPGLGHPESPLVESAGRSFSSLSGYFVAA